uniref:Putative secreted protein n=1 Tax=Anopheles darlingi TaxID=43151 RepID=A0A2M4DJG9_ANODA
MPGPGAIAACWCSIMQILSAPAVEWHPFSIGEAPLRSIAVAAASLPDTESCIASKHRREHHTRTESKARDNGMTFSRFLPRACD